MVIPSNLIVNADDFGANSRINSAISKCFALGIINSTSIIVNMEGFLEAIKMSKEYGFSNKIGVHVNLTSGRSLTNLSSTKWVDANGFFIKKRIYKKISCSGTEEKKMLITEIESQLKALYDNNITPTHINSHQHIHTLPWLVLPFLYVAKKYKIKIRITQTWNKSNNLIVPVYRSILNRIYKRNKLNFTERFETLKSYAESRETIKRNQTLTEIMVHPDLNSNNDIYDSQDGNTLEMILNTLNN